MGLKLAIGLRMDVLPPVAPGWILPGASLDLDFANGRYYAEGGGALSSLLSCSRAGSGLAQNADGSWTSFGSNVPRITDRGLLVEEARTNSIKNNSMAGASVGSAIPTNWGSNVNNGLTTSVTGLGTEFGLPYIDIRWSGTTNGTGTFAQMRFSNTIEIASSQGQVWTNSLFIRIVGGSTANINAFSVIINEHASGGGYLGGASASFTPTGSMQRVSFTRALSDASVAFAVPFVGIGHGVSVLSIDVTLRIYAPQMELGAFATSPLLTTSAAVTRGADVISLAGSASVAALAAKAMAFETNLVNTTGLARLFDSNDALRPAFRISDTLVRLTNDGGSTNADAAFGSGSFAGVAKFAFGMDSSSFTAIVNGGTKGTQVSIWGAMTPPVYLGNRAAADRALGGYLCRATFVSTKGVFDGLTV